MIKTLVVDDEKKARDILTGMLNTHCPQIEVIGQADSVIAAEELIRSLKPDLVLLDIEMPFGNGFDLLDKTRDLNFEVIFITAFDHYAVKAPLTGLFKIKKMKTVLM
jgi:two-component system LytT family response regulator